MATLSIAVILTGWVRGGGGKNFIDEIPRICQIDFWHNHKNIFGYEFTYLAPKSSSPLNDASVVSQSLKGKYQVGHHISSHVVADIADVECKTMMIDAEGGEFINFFKVYSEILVDRVEIKTNQGHEFTVGAPVRAPINSSQTVEKAEMSDQNKLIAIRAGLGGHIHNT